MFYDRGDLTAFYDCQQCSKSCCANPPPLVLATKKHLVTTGYVRIYRHGNSAQKFGASTPIVATSNQILGKAFSAALLYCVVRCECICVDRILCVYVCVWCLGGTLARKSLITRPRGFEIRLSSIVLYSPLYSFALKLCSTLSPLEQNDETHLALQHPPKGGGMGCSPVPLSLMLDTRLQSPLHQSRGLGMRPSSSRASCCTHTRERQDKAVFPSSDFNKANFLTRDVRKHKKRKTL